MRVTGCHYPDGHVGDGGGRSRLWLRKHRAESDLKATTRFYPEGRRGGNDFAFVCWECRSAEVFTSLCVIMPTHDHQGFSDYRESLDVSSQLGEDSRR